MEVKGPAAAWSAQHSQCVRECCEDGASARVSSDSVAPRRARPPHPLSQGTNLNT